MKGINLIPIVKELGVNNVSLIEALVDEVLAGGDIDKNYDVIDLRQALHVFKSKVKAKLKKWNRNFSKLVEKEQQWLEGKIFVKRREVAAGPGRKSKKWEDLGNINRLLNL